MKKNLLANLLSKVIFSLYTAGKCFKSNSRENECVNEVLDSKFKFLAISQPRVNFEYLAVSNIFQTRKRKKRQSVLCKSVLTPYFLAGGIGSDRIRDKLVSYDAVGAKKSKFA